MADDKIPEELTVLEVIRSPYGSRQIESVRVEANAHEYKKMNDFFKDTPLIVGFIGEGTNRNRVVELKCKDYEMWTTFRNRS